MPWYKGLPEAAQRGFVDPFMENQKQAKQDARTEEQGRLIKEALTQMLPDAAAKYGINLVNPKIMPAVAGLFTDQAGQDATNTRTDAVTKEKNAREDAQDTEQRAREMDGFYETVSLKNPALANKWRKEGKYFTPDQRIPIYRQIEEPGIIAKRLQGVKAMYPNVPADQLTDLKSIDDWVAREEDRQRFENQKTLRGMTGSGERKPQTVPDIEETQLSSSAKTALSVGRKILKEQGIKGLQESMQMGDMKFATQYLSDEEDQAIGRILVSEYFAPQQSVPSPALPQRETGFNPQGMQKAPINKVVGGVKNLLTRENKYGPGY